MKKLVKLAAVAALCLASVAASAQIKVGANAGAFIPMGTFGDMAGTGFGGGLSGKYMLNDNMAVGLNAGYYTFGEKDLIIAKYKMSIIPVAANFTYYFGEGSFKPYAGLDLGMYMVKTDVTIETSGLSDLFSDLSDLSDTDTSSSDASSSDTNDSQTKIGFAPVVGCEYNFTDALGLDVNAKYHYIMTEGDASTGLAINLGLVYSFGK